MTSTDAPRWAPLLPCWLYVPKQLMLLPKRAVYSCLNTGFNLILKITTTSCVSNLDLFHRMFSGLIPIVVCISSTVQNPYIQNQTPWSITWSNINKKPLWPKTLRTYPSKHPERCSRDSIRHNILSQVGHSFVFLTCKPHLHIQWPPHLAPYPAERERCNYVYNSKERRS